MSSIVKIFSLMTLLVLLFPGQALAYIDPGVGSMLLQGAAAALIAGLVFFRRFRAKIVGMFQKKDEGEDKEGDA